GWRCRETYGAWRRGGTPPARLGVTGVRMRPASADLPYPLSRSPGIVRRPDISVQAVAECHAQPVGEREALAANPSPRGPLGISGGHRLDSEPVAGQQRPCEVPAPAV